LVPDGILSPDVSAVYPLSKKKIRTGRFIYECFTASPSASSAATAVASAGSGTWSVISELATGVDCATTADSSEDYFSVATQAQNPALSASAVRFEMTIHRPLTLNAPWPTMKHRIVVEVAMPTIGYGQ
jgi:hypothetical protein